jgi:BA14K-like protein
MSKPFATLLTAAAFTIGLMAHPGPAAAAPAANMSAVAKTPVADLAPVRWGGGWHGGWHGGWRGGGWGYYGGGFAAGAILGGMLAAPYYYPSPYYYGDPGYYEDAAPDGAVDYCMRRFRSYDPRSGTYLGNDGRRHPCP